MNFSWFIDPIRSHYVDFNGVTGRRPFWMFILYQVVIAIIVFAVSYAIHLPLLYSIFSLALLLPSLGIEVRRLHDIGKSGWWMLIGLVPILGAIYLIYLFAQPTSQPFQPTYQ